MDLQQIILSGTIFSNPHDSIQDGRKVVCFTLQCFRPGFDKRNGHADRRTNYYSIFKSFPLECETDKFLQKGMRVFVTGEPFVIQRENADLLTEQKIAVRAKEVFALDKPSFKDNNKFANTEEIL